MKVVQEEIFGPVIVALPFDDDDEGIALANGTEFGLYDYVFSEGPGARDGGQPPHAGRQHRDQHGAAQPGDAVRRHEAVAASVATAARSASTRTPTCSPSSGPVRDGVRDLPLGPRARVGDATSTSGCSTRSRSRSRPTGPGSSTAGSPSTTSSREYSHISANEVFMGYVAARTERMHIGSGIFNLTPPVNHPARVAERVAMLDHLSNGRFELGVGRGSSSTEYQGFGIPDPDAHPRPLRRGAARDRAHAHDAIRTRTTATGSRCRSAACCRGRTRSRTRRSGSRAGARRRSRRPAGSAWARSASRWASPRTSSRSSRRTGTRSRECDEPVGEYVNENVACVSMLLCLEDRERAIELFRSEQRRRTTSRSSCAGSTRSRCRSRSTAPTFTVPEPTLRGAERGGRRRAGAASARRRTSRGRSSAGSGAGADQLIFGMLDNTLPLEVAQESIEIFGRDVIPAFDTDPVHSTTRQREAAGRSPR